MSYRISELTAGTPPYLGSALLELSIANPGMPSGYESRKALLADIAAAIGDIEPPPVLPTFPIDAVVYGGLDGAPTGDTDVLRIDPVNGRLGIANSAPASTLAVGTVAATAYTSNVATSSADFERALIGNWSGADVAQFGTVMGGTGLARDVSILHGGTERLRIAPTTTAVTGMLGIGTIPQAHLHVLRAAGGLGTPVTAQTAYFQSTTTGLFPDVLIVDQDNAATRATLQIKSSAGEIAFFASSGLVGLGTVTPGAGLHVSRAAAGGMTTAVCAHFQSTFTNTVPDVLIVDQDNAVGRAALAVQGNAGVAPILFCASNGRVGIGSNVAPQAHLSVGTVGATAYTSNLDSDTTNYERCLIGSWSGANVAQFGTTMLGAGVARDVTFLRGGVSRIELNAAGIKMPGLPTANPAVVGQLWNNAGVLSVSAG